MLYRNHLIFGLVFSAVVASFWIVGGTAPLAGDERFPNASVLMSTEELEVAHTDPDIRIIDLRDSEKFKAGRVPFAFSLPSAALLDRESRIRGVRRSDAELSQMFGLMGIGKESRVVIYDDAGGHEAARLYWILQYLGHPSVSLLDGGFPKWQKEARPISREIRQVAPGNFPTDLAPWRLATADWILDHAEDPDVIILDVRSPSRYLESHIPGAVNLFWKEANLNKEGAWKDPDELLALYESIGVTKDKDIVVYCQGGNHNGHTYVTLKALGYTQVRSYDRAWPEWSGDSSLPVSVGPDPGGMNVGARDEVPGLDSGLGALETTLIAALAVMTTITLVVIVSYWRAMRRAGGVGHAGD